MKPFQWRTHPDIIARFVKTQEIATWRKCDIILKPNEVMGVMQDGKIVNTYTEQKVKAAVGGLGRKLFRTAEKMDERYLFAIGTPFQVPIPFKVQSSDQLEISGVTTIEYQLQLDDVVKLINLFAARKIEQPKDSGPGILLTRNAIGDMLYQEFFARVYQEVLGNIELSQLRADPNTQTNLAAALDSEMRRTTNEIGLTYRTSHTVFDPNAHDEVQKYKGKFNLDQVKLGVDQEAELLVLEREYELLSQEIELGAQCTLAAVKGEGAVELEKRRNDIRIQREQAEADFDINVREQQNALEVEREQWELEQAAADKELDRRIAAGETVGQEREFKLEQQDRRDALVTDQRDKDRDGSTDRSDKDRDVGSDQRDKDRSSRDQWMNMDTSNMSEAERIAYMQTIAALNTQDALTQRDSKKFDAETQANLEREKTATNKEMMKQQTAQQFIDKMDDSTGDTSLIQGDNIVGTSIGSSAGTMISGNINIGQIGGTPIGQMGGTPAAPPPPLPSGQTPAPPCSRCGNATRFIAQYNRHYCDACANYVG